MPKTIKIRCPACNSANTLTKRNGESWCRKCGKVWDTPKGEEK